MRSSRRSFLKIAAASAGPLVLPSHVFSAATAPSGRVTMGFIGMGKQSHHLLGAFLGQETQVVAVCDVDTTRREDGKKRVEKYYEDRKRPAKVDAYRDFRELIGRADIDAVCIATPDHWHAIITLAALRAGKDVYCEKPLTHNIHEAIEVMKAVGANRRVLQTGSMQRSSKEFRIACELVQNGAIGKVRKVECEFGDPGVPCNLPEEATEPGLDWEMWLGPAPARLYNSTLSPRGVHDHFPNWRNYREYGGGMVTDWGAHHLDIAQWGLGMDNSGPVEVLPPEKTGAKRGAKLVYANGVTVEHKGGFGVHFFGSDGEVQVNRGKFGFKRGDEQIALFTGDKDNKEKEQGTSCAAQVQKAEKAYLKDAKIKLYASRNHITDFMEAIASRKKPITSEIVGGRTAICCHLMNLAYYHGKRIKWDPRGLVFAGGTGDRKWLTREYRGPWKV